MKTIGPDDLNRRLKVDEIILQMRDPKGRAIGLLPEFRTGRAPFVLVRKALIRASALSKYQDDRKRHHSSRLSRWEDCERFARNASKAIDALAKKLPINMYGVEERYQLTEPIRLTLRAAKKDASEDERYRLALEQASGLLAARALLQEVAENTRRYRRSLTEGRSKPGELAKLEFALAMAEWWRQVTGQVPGSGKDITNSPFLRFLAASWEDVCGEEDVSFARQANRALKMLRGDEPRKFIQ